MFECRYTHDWPYAKALSDHIRRRKRTGWVILLVFCCAMLAFCLWAKLHALLTVYFSAMVVLCLYRAFLWRRLSTRAQWERVCAAAKADRIEAAFLLDGEGVRFTQRGETAAQFPWSACARLSEDGDWIALTLKGKKRAAGASFFLPRNGFADGTGEAFLAWAAEEHRELFSKKEDNGYV